MTNAAQDTRSPPVNSAETQPSYKPGIGGGSIATPSDSSTSRCWAKPVSRYSRPPLQPVARQPKAGRFNQRMLCLPALSVGSKIPSRHPVRPEDSVSG